MPPSYVARYTFFLPTVFVLTVFLLTAFLLTFFPPLCCRATAFLARLPLEPFRPTAFVAFVRAVLGPPAPSEGDTS